MGFGRIFDHAKKELISVPLSLNQVMIHPSKLAFRLARQALLILQLKLYIVKSASFFIDGYVDFFRTRIIYDKSNRRQRDTRAGTGKSRKELYSTSLVQLYNLISTRPAVQIMSRIQCMLHEIYLSSHLVCMIKG